MTRIYPPQLPIAPTGRVYPPVENPDYWNSIKYTLADAVVTTSAGITATALPNGDIQIDVAAGKVPDANPSTGFSLAWKMKDSVTGKETNFGAIGYQGILEAWLGIVSGLGGLNDVEISIGISQATDLSANSVTAASITDNSQRIVAVWRWIPSVTSFSRSADSSGTGTSTALYFNPSRNATSGGYIQGQLTGIGLTTLDERNQAPAGSPFDAITSAIGNVGVGEYFIINVRNSGLLNIATNRTYVLRPKLIAINWAS